MLQCLWWLSSFAHISGHFRDSATPLPSEGMHTRVLSYFANMQTCPCAKLPPPPYLKTSIPGRKQGCLAFICALPNSLNVNGPEDSFSPSDSCLETSKLLGSLLGSEFACSLQTSCNDLSKLHLISWVVLSFLSPISMRKYISKMTKSIDMRKYTATLLKNKVGKSCSHQSWDSQLFY